MMRVLLLAGMLGFQDMRQAYRRSFVGPFWLTIGIAVQIAATGLVFGLIFKVEMTEYLPFLTVSTILWLLISNVLNEGCMTFVTAEPLIKQLNSPALIHVLRTVWKNLLIAGHNIAILPIVFIIFRRLPEITLVSFLPGIAILLLNITWISWLFALINARFRDFQPIVASLMTVALYLTPVMWYPKLLGNSEFAHLLLGLNPFYHWLQIVRLPILGEWPTLENWGLSLLSAGVGWMITLLAYRKYRNMIAYWV